MRLLKTLSNKKQNILEVLANEAKKSNMKSLHAAGLVKNGKLLEKGHNSHRELIGGNAVNSTHAEISVIHKLLKTQKKIDADLWVIRVTKEGELVNSEPCLSCIVALKKYNIKRVFYSDSEGDIICIKLNDIIIKDSYKTRYQRMNGVYTNWSFPQKFKQ